MGNQYQTLLERLGFERLSPTKSSLALTEDDLQQIEEKLGRSLPQDYKKFLKDYPGIWLNKGCFPLNINGRQKEVCSFRFSGSTHEHDLADFYFSVQRNLEGDDENCSLEWYPGISLLRNTNKYSQNVGWPPELLPIGFDLGGNLICLALEGLRPGAIFFWMSLPSEDKPNLYLIASSFDEFMHLLKCADGE